MAINFRLLYREVHMVVQESSMISNLLKSYNSVTVTKRISICCEFLMMRLSQ